MSAREPGSPKPSYFVFPPGITFFGLVMSPSFFSTSESISLCSKVYQAELPELIEKTRNAIR